MLDARGAIHPGDQLGPRAPSAGGMFAAMGGRGLGGARAAEDFYATDDGGDAVRALIAAEKGRLPQGAPIWECAAGDGAMAREVAGCGHPVICSDLVDRGCGAIVRSFYRFRRPPAQRVITNPPYDECNAAQGKGRWIWHGMRDLGLDYMALLLAWNWPGAGGHAALWDAYPPARVYLLRWRIDWSGKGAPPMLNAWFVFEKGHAGPSVLIPLDKVSA